MTKITNLEVEQFLDSCKKTSEIEFLEEGKLKKDLIESAKKRGILIEGSRDLGVIKTIYCFTDKPNSNGAILPSKEFQRKLPQIVGKPMNVGHIRDLIVGYYIDYKYILKENKAITYAIFFKSNYEDLWKKAKLFKSRNKLSSSFEIWSPQSKRKYRNDGSYELHQMELAGGALIFEEHGQEPAFKDAKVLEVSKKLNINECIGEECLVCASKYKEEEIIVADTDYFKKSVIENLKKLQEERKAEETKKTEPKVVDTKPEEKKVEVKVEEKKPEQQTGKIKCSNCSEEMDYNGIDVRIKCPKCFAILNKEGVMQYPPQIKDFRVLCPSCNIGNWLILSRDEKEARLRCEGCAKEYRVEFPQNNVDIQKLLDKVNFVYTGGVTCPQCRGYIKISGTSTLKDRTVNCPKCKVEFSFNITHEQYKKISKIEEIKIDKIEKSAKTEKGGKEMDCKLELSKFHRYIDVEKFEDFEKSLSEDYDEKEMADKAARLTYQQRKALPDSDFAVVVRVKNKKTGKIRKIRMFPIHDEAHVKNALARLGQDAPQATLRKLGVSINTVKAKILRKARQLKMTDLLERYKKAKKEKAQNITLEDDKTTTVTTASDNTTVTISDVTIVEDKKEIKKDELTKAQKHDLELYALEDRVAKYATGIKKLASKVITMNKELKMAKSEKEKEINFYKENAKKILERREELGDFAKGISDENIVKDEEFEKIKLEKAKVELDKIETASEIVGDKEKDSDYYGKTRKEIDNAAFGEVNKRMKIN